MMKKTLTIMVVCLLLCFSLPFACQARSKVTRMVVFDFKNETEHTELGKQVAEMARIIIPEFKGFEVVDRGIMRTLISENGSDIDEIIDSGDGLKAAKLMNSDYFIVGSVGMLAGIYSLNIKLIDSNSGLILKAEGIEFKDMTEIRKLVRGLLASILGYGEISGKQVINETEFQKLEKSPSTALSLSIASTIIQASALGYALSDEKSGALYPSIALMIPPMTSIYTEDWDIAPITIGFSFGAGVFNYIGYSLLNNPDQFKVTFGSALIVMGGCAKIFAVYTDITHSTSSVEKYNKELRGKYFIAENVELVPLLSAESTGLAVVVRY